MLDHDSVKADYSPVPASSSLGANIESERSRWTAGFGGRTAFGLATKRAIFQSRALRLSFGGIAV